MSDFKKGQLILVRCKGFNYFEWVAQMYIAEDKDYVFGVGNSFAKFLYDIIPFEGNEHLLGAHDDPEPKWEPKPGELVAVSNDGEDWQVRVFVRRIGELYSCVDYQSRIPVLDSYKSQEDVWDKCDPIHKRFSIPGAVS